MDDVEDSLRWDDELESEADDTSWEDDHGFGLTDTDLEILTSKSWTPEDTVRYTQLSAQRFKDFWKD